MRSCVRAYVRVFCGLVYVSVLLVSSNLHLLDDLPPSLLMPYVFYDFSFSFSSCLVHVAHDILIPTKVVLS